MVDSEIALDADTNITAIDYSRSHAMNTDVVVKIPLEQVSSPSSMGSQVASNRKKELLKKAKDSDSNASRSYSGEKKTNQQRKPQNHIQLLRF